RNMETRMAKGKGYHRTVKYVEWKGYKYQSSRNSGIYGQVIAIWWAGYPYKCISFGALHRNGCLFCSPTPGYRRGVNQSPFTSYRECRSSSCGSVQDEATGYSCYGSPLFFSFYFFVSSRPESGIVVR